MLLLFVIHRLKGYPEGRGPPLRSEACLGISLKFDEFPDLINAAIFSTTNVVSFCERNKEKHKNVHILRHFLCLLSPPLYAQGADYYSQSAPYLFFLFLTYAALALATIALKASGWFIAKSAKTLRLISIPALCKAPISLE